MIHKQEKEFAQFERNMLKHYGLRPNEVEKLRLYQIACWLEEDRKQKTKQLFEQMVKNNARTRN